MSLDVKTASAIRPVIFPGSLLLPRIRGDAVRRRLPVVPGAADGQQDDAAASRWFAEPVEHLHVLFPGHAAARICLCALVGDPF